MEEALTLKLWVVQFLQPAMVHWVAEKRSWHSSVGSNRKKQISRGISGGLLESGERKQPVVHSAQVYNTDETSLFYKMLSLKTLVVENELATCGYIQQKAWIAVLACTDTNSSHELWQLENLCMLCASKILK